MATKNLFATTKKKINKNKNLFKTKEEDFWTILERNNRKYKESIASEKLEVMIVEKNEIVDKINNFTKLSQFNVGKDLRENFKKKYIEEDHKRDMLIMIREISLNLWSKQYELIENISK